MCRACLSSVDPLTLHAAAVSRIVSFFGFEDLFEMIAAKSDVGIAGTWTRLDQTH